MEAIPSLPSSKHEPQLDGRNAQMFSKPTIPWFPSRAVADVPRPDRGVHGTRFSAHGRPIIPSTALNDFLRGAGGTDTSAASAESTESFLSAAIIASFWSAATVSNLSAGTIGLIAGNTGVLGRGAGCNDMSAATSKPAESFWCAAMYSVCSAATVSNRSTGTILGLFAGNISVGDLGVKSDVNDLRGCSMDLVIGALIAGGNVCRLLGGRFSAGAGNLSKNNVKLSNICLRVWPGDSAT